MTTALTEHTKTILRAIADGKEITHRDDTTNTPYGLQAVLACIAGGNEKLLRIAPETRSINGVEFGATTPNSSYHLTIFKSNAEPARIFNWTEAKDRDTAYRAIVDALEGKNHA